MLQINGLENGLEIFKCLGSEVRMQIVHLLSQNGEMNLNELASALELTNGALTSHVRMLEQCGIIQTVPSYTGRGLQKICSLKVDQMLMNVYPVREALTAKAYETSIRIGHYSDYAAGPSCGIACREKLIGTENDPRCFAYPERVDAEMIWLHDGYVEYRIPNQLPEGQRIDQITLSFEVGAADQGSESDTQSMLHFLLNGKEMGHWLSIKSMDADGGIYTPGWWQRRERRCGFLKMLVINRIGAFLDGVMMAETGNGYEFLDGSGEMHFRFEARSENGNNGGLALYGRGFGNYQQDIQVRVHYMPEDTFYG